MAVPRQLQLEVVALRRIGIIRLMHEQHLEHVLRKILQRTLRVRLAIKHVFYTDHRYP
ncbi:hypothetical protein D3C71_2138900 [compost metagenome]